MKRFFLTSICAIAVVVAGQTSAFSLNAIEPLVKGKSFETGIYKTKAGKLNINVVKSDTETPTIIQLTNMNHELVYAQKISKKNKKFGIQVNIDDLEPGKYTLSITSNGEKELKEIKIEYPTLEKTISIN